MHHLHFVLLLIIPFLTANAQNIKVKRVTDNIIELNENYFRSVAIRTNKGIVLIDTREPLEKMEEIKKLVQQEFKTDSFCYIINTHGCPEHILGNPALPKTPVIMNENFFNRRKIYLKQRSYVDSMEVVCRNISDTIQYNKICADMERGKNWRQYCTKALNIFPDITYNESMDLHFNDLTIKMFLTGVGHGYSTFIFIPEENFLHVSTFDNRFAIPLFIVPDLLDNPDFLSYQINTLEKIVGMTDTSTYVIPGHGGNYPQEDLKQMIYYYSELYDYSKKAFSSKTDVNTFTTHCKLENIFPDQEIYLNLKQGEQERHEQNLGWLWDYFSNQHSRQKSL